MAPPPVSKPAALIALVTIYVVIVLAVMYSDRQFQHSADHRRAAAARAAAPPEARDS